MARLLARGSRAFGSGSGPVLLGHAWRSAEPLMLGRAKSMAIRNKHKPWVCNV